MNAPLPAIASGEKIIGIGIDLVDIPRIQRAAERNGEAFFQRIFTPAERAYCEQMGAPWASFAARWAAKEAVSKAFGTGIGPELSLTSISVENDARGAPSIVLDGQGEKLLRARGGKRIHISLTHTNTLAQAFAIITG